VKARGKGGQASSLGASCAHGSLCHSSSEEWKTHFFLAGAGPSRCPTRNVVTSSAADFVDGGAPRKAPASHLPQSFVFHKASPPLPNSLPLPVCTPFKQALKTWYVFARHQHAFDSPLTTSIAQKNLTHPSTWGTSSLERPSRPRHPSKNHHTRA